MTIGAASRVSLACDGVTKVFPVAIQAYAATDLTVILTAPVSAGGVETTLVLNSDYSMAASGTLQPSAWTLTTLPVAAYLTGYTLQVFANPVQTQQTSYVQGQAFPSAAVQTNFDRLTQMVQRLQDQINRAIRAPDGDLNPLMLLETAAQRAGLGAVFDVNGNISTGAIPTVTFTQAIFNAFLSGAWIGSPPTQLTAGEIAAGITPVNFFYQPTALGVDARRYGYAPDNGGTDNTAAIQNAFNANAGCFPVIIPGGGYGKMTARVTAAANLHLIMREGAELRWSTTTATGTNLLGAVTRPGIEVTGDNFLLEGRGKLTGPSVGAYVANECGLLRIGTSAANRVTGFIVRDVEITQWGAYGVVLQFMQDIECTGMSVHNNGFHGYAFLSCQYGRVKRNKIYSMTPGISGNMYGLSCTHDSTSYNTDPNVTAAPRQTVNPFCIDFDVSENEVYGINWIGLDGHGGYELNYHDNKVYDCYIGIQVAGSSGAAINYAGENNKINTNSICATQINGNATTTSGHSGQQYGITVNGGTTLLHRGVEVIGNTIVGCGDVSGAGGNAYSIQCTLMQDAVILGNSIRGWYSVGIYGANFDGAISNNVFTGPANATLSKVLWLDSNSAKSTLNGNRLEIHGGAVPLEGIRISSAGSTRPVVGANEMTQAATPYSGNAALFTSGMSDVTPRVQDATTGSHTVDVGPLGAPQVAYVEYIGGGAGALTDLLNPRQGTVYVIGVSVNQTLTVSGAAYKLSGATAAITQFGTLSLLCVATSNPKFQEIGRSLTNT